MSDDLAQILAGVLARMDAPDISTAEELRLRRLDMLEGVRRILGTEGEVPGWVEELERRADAAGDDL